MEDSLPANVKYFVWQSLEMIHKQFPESKVYYYMDILLYGSKADTLERMFEEVKKILPCCELQIAPEKTKRRFY